MRPVLLALLVVAVGGFDADEWPFNYADGLGSELERLCVNVANSYECAQAVERFQLVRRVPGISRQGPVLRIRTIRGRTVALHDSASRDDSQGVWYSYLKPLRDVGYHLVHKQLYEGTSYLLIGMHTGARYEIHEVPVISPDRRRFVTASACGEACYNPNAIQIWRFSTRGPKLEWTFEPKDWEPLSTEWLSPRKIRIVMGDFHGARIGEVLVTRSQRGWTFTPANK